MEQENSEICNYLKGKTVFITGGTGFLGKALVEKLIRVGQLKRIYVLIRDKKGVFPKDRLDKIFRLPLFDKIKETQEYDLEKVVAITGDCSEEGLGLDNETYRTLVEEVAVVFHCAATVRFDEKLQIATNLNIRALRDLLEMSKNMTKLTAFVHVSTAYSNSIRLKIDEVFYEPPMTAENAINVMESLTAEQIDKLTLALIGKYPNTYTFTKCISEDLIRRYRNILPVTIVRPSIIVNTYKEPISGWIDTFYGPLSIMAAVAIGILRIARCDADQIADLVPLDYVVNNLIAAAWKVSKRDSNEEIPIYNYVSRPENPIKWGEYIGRFLEYHETLLALDNSIWYTFMYLTKYKLLYKISAFFLHTIPGHIIDTIAIIKNKKPMLVNTYKKMDKLFDSLHHFSRNDFKFGNGATQKLWLELNPSDQEMFQFSMQNFDWDEYIDLCQFGLRLYIFKRPVDTIEKGIRRQKMLKVLHYITVTIIIVLVFSFFYCFL